MSHETGGWAPSYATTAGVPVTLLEIAQTQQFATTVDARGMSHQYILHGDRGSSDVI